LGPRRADGSSRPASAASTRAPDRRFASKDSLIDELLRLAVEELVTATDQALARSDGQGLRELLTTLGQSFAAHARYASLLLERPTDAATSRRIHAAIDELTKRAVAAGAVLPDTTSGDVHALILAMRGLVQAADEAAPADWRRFLDVHLAGLRAPRL
jgi:AcrR family transcriptional regulator